MTTPPRILKLGVMYSADHCAWCGSTENLKATINLATRAGALRCVNDVECLRRIRLARIGWAA